MSLVAICAAPCCSVWHGRTVLHGCCPRARSGSRRSRPTSGSSRASRPRWESRPRTISSTRSTRSLPSGSASWDSSLALVLQLSMRRYVAWTYWFAVVMVGVFGTMAADVLHVRFGVPYAVSSVLYAVVLAAVFVVLAADREDALVSHHRHCPPGAVLLGRGCRHLRVRDGGRRPDGHDLPSGVRIFDPALRRANRSSRPRLPAIPMEPDLLFLVRLCHHTPARRILRRLGGQAARS